MAPKSPFKKLLVVDADKKFSARLKRYFKARDVDVLSCPDVAACEGRIRAFAPDLTVIHASSVAGLIDALGALTKRFPEIPAVIAGDRANADLVIAAFRNGAADFVANTSPSKDIAAVFDQVIGRTGRDPQNPRAGVDAALLEHVRMNQLLREIAIAVNESETADEAMQICIDSVCTFTGWPVGHVFVRADDPSLGRDTDVHLKSSAIWHFDNPRRFKDLKKATETFDIRPGIGFPGIVLETRKPLWAPEPQNNWVMPRRETIEKHGLLGAFVFPVLIGDEVAAVMEFLAAERPAENALLVDGLIQIGTQIGRIIERERGRSGQQRFYDAIENLSDGLVMWDAEDRFIACNSKFREDAPQAVREVLVPGTAFETYVRARTKSDFDPNRHGSPEELFELSMSRRNDEITELFRDGKWVQITKKWRDDGGIVEFHTDITDLKEAETALRLSEARFRDFATAAADRFFETDKDLKFVLFTEPVRRLDLSEKDFVGQSMLELMPADARCSEGVIGHELVKSHQPLRDVRFSRIGSDGSKTYVCISATPYFDADGNFAGYRGTTIDETDEVNARKRAKEANQRLVDALDAVSGGIVLFDAQDRFVFGNRQYHQRYSGIADKLVPGTSVEEISWAVAEAEFGDAGEDAVRQWVDDRMENLRNLDTPLVRRRGNGDWQLITQYRTEEGGTLVIAADITAQKNAEDAARQNEATARAFLNATRDRAMLVDLDGKIVMANEAAVVDFGKTPDEVVGMRTEDIYSKNLAASRRAYADKVAKTGQAINIEARYLAETGLWLESTIYPVFGADGDVIQIAFFSRDVTGIKASELALKKSEQRFKDFASSAADRFWETDQDHRYTYMSEPVGRLSMPSDQIVGKTVWEAFSGSFNFEGGINFPERVAARKPFRDVRSSGRLDNGETAYFRHSGTPYFDENGEFLGFRGITIDETAEVEARLQAESAQRQFMEAIDLLPDGFVLWDADDRFVAGNESFLESLTEAERDVLEPGIKYEDYVRRRLEIDAVPEAKGREEEWVRERLRLREHVGVYETNASAEGHWLRVYRRKLPDGRICDFITDVTEIRAAEQALAESERRFKDFAASAADRFWETDENHRFTFYSDPVGRLSRPTESLVGKTHWEVFVDDLTFEGRADLKADFESHQPFRDLRAQQIYEDGTVAYFRYSGTPYFDGAGNFKGFRGITVDDTDEVLAKKEAESTQQQFLDAINLLPDGLVLWDSDHRFVMCNAKFRSNLTPEEARILKPGLPFEEYLRCRAELGFGPGPGEDLDTWVEQRVHERPKQGTFETLILGRWHRVYHRELPDGQTFDFITDVTEIKKAEQALEATEKRFKDFAESAADRFWETGPDHRFTYVSEPVGRLSIPAEAMLGKEPWKMGFGEYADADNSASHEEMRRMRAFRDRQGTLVGPDGSKVYVKISGTPFFDEHGEFQGFRGTLADQTDEVLAKKEAESVQKQFLDAIDLLPDGMILWDADQRFVMCNAKFKANLTPEETHVLKPGLPYVDYLRCRAELGFGPNPGEDVETWVARRFHERENQDTFETLVLGRWHRVYPRQLPDGRTLDFVTDVTEIKKAEHALEASEKRFRDFAESAADRFWETDRDHRLSYISEASGRIAFPTELFIGKPPWEVELEWSDFDQIIQIRDLMQAHKPFRDQRVSIPLEDDLEIIHISAAGVPFFDDNGAFQGYRGTLTDQTDEVLAREREESTQQRFFDAIENMPDAFVLWDPDYCLVTCNTRYREIFEEASEYLEPGRHFSEIFRAYAKAPETYDIEDADKWINERLEWALEEFTDRETKFRGHWYHLRRQRLASGYTIVMLADITDAKLRTQELEAARKELEQAERLAVLGQLTGTVAHEIRNPLGTIRTSTAIIDHKLRDQGLGIEKALDRIARNIERCDTIISELLDYARAPSTEFSNVAMDQWLREYLTDHEMPREIEFTFSPAAPEVSVAVDREGIRRVIVNVIDNAVQAMCGKDGDREEPPIGGKLEVATQVTDEFYEIRVIDNGPGIPEDVRVKIFEPLFSTKSFGVGLGLPTVQKILERHGGGIEINNREAGGTEARIWLPLSDADTAECVA